MRSFNPRQLVGLVEGRVEGKKGIPLKRKRDEEVWSSQKVQLRAFKT
jgi:hypothetical protein